MKVKYFRHSYKSTLPPIDPQWLVKYIPGSRMKNSTAVTAKLYGNILLSFYAVNNKTTILVMVMSQTPYQDTRVLEKTLQEFTRLPIRLEKMNTWVYYDKTIVNNDFTAHTLDVNFRNRF